MSTRAAVIGIGNKGWKGWADGLYTKDQTHVGAIFSSEMELVAVADTNKDLLAEFATWIENQVEGMPPDFEVTGYPDYQDLMYEKPEVVVIATPPSTHVQLARNLMRYDSVKCIVLEKPACTSVKESRDLLTSRNNYGVPIIVNHSRRWMANWREFKTKVEMMGGATHITGYCNGETFDAGSHMADLFDFLGKDAKHQYINLYDKEKGKYMPYLVFDVIAHCPDGVVELRTNGHFMQWAPLAKGFYRDLQYPNWNYLEGYLCYDDGELLGDATVSMMNEAAAVARGEDVEITCSAMDGIKAALTALEWMK